MRQNSMINSLVVNDRTALQSLIFIKDSRNTEQDFEFKLIEQLKAKHTLSEKSKCHNDIIK